jgi:hypothetical protein
METSQQWRKMKWTSQQGEFQAAEGAQAGQLLTPAKAIQS